VISPKGNSGSRSTDRDLSIKSARSAPKMTLWEARSVD
jgi:hypothetical protein